MPSGPDPHRLPTPSDHLNLNAAVSLRHRHQRYIRGVEELR
jgi:hypothetical protein